MESFRPELGACFPVHCDGELGVKPVVPFHGTCVCCRDGVNVVRERDSG